LREREGKTLTNFSRTLPAEDSDLTQQIVKAPYLLKFLALSSSAKERELLKHLRDLLLELGPGFAFVGSQVQLEVDGQPFYIDLLFYRLRRTIALGTSNDRIRQKILCHREAV
jgi:predicted nuclease of restriction endonuclease-like (RecB) superfamily